MSRIWNWALLVFVVFAVVGVRLAGQSADFPTFVLPDVPDLTIKTQRTIDRRSSWHLLAP
jgi:hypothetical protein